MTNIKEQLSAHYDPAESSDLLDRDIGAQDRTMLDKIVKDFAPKLKLHPVGEMLEPSPILTQSLDDSLDSILYEKPAMQMRGMLKMATTRKASKNLQQAMDGIGVGAKLKKIFSR